jgi:hypothetical protein
VTSRLDHAALRAATPADAPAVAAVTLERFETYRGFADACRYRRGLDRASAVAGSGSPPGGRPRMTRVARDACNIRRSGVVSSAMQDGEHRELMLAAIASEGEAHSALLAGDAETARAGYARAVEQYRASWALAPPKSYGRLVGLVKAGVLAGDAPAAAAEVRAALDGDADADGSPVAAYVLAVAALIAGDDDEVAVRAARMEPRGDAFERTAAALRALAVHDAIAYANALAAIAMDFSARPEHLTGVAIADTAVMLESLAAEREMAVKPNSPLVPAI